ncbi:papilin-like [Cydia splendana]|uniref:papilin-like n=1 Tax=Cydia splendana TaxID=1100963 RepID=UPI00300DA3FF
MCRTKNGKITIMLALSLYLSVLITTANSQILNMDNSTTDTTTTTNNTTTTTTRTTLPYVELENKTTKVTYPSLSYWTFDVHCKFQPDAFQCSKPDRFGERWYYDIKMEDCKPFKYFRCKSNNNNNFRTYAECREFCRGKYSQTWCVLAPNKRNIPRCIDAGPHAIENVLPVNAACHMQADFGDCQDYIEMFYYDISARRCLGFAFSGCGGNQNRFYSDKTCATVCTAGIENTVD